MMITSRLTPPLTAETPEVRSLISKARLLALTQRFTARPAALWELVFSIPSAQAKPVIDQIIKYGRTRRGWLGVRVQRVTDEIAETLGLEEARGALIASVNDEGPAKESGLQSGDIILEVNDQGIKEMRALPRIIAEYDVGTKAEIVYWRDNKEHKATVTIGELEKAEDEGLIQASAEEPFHTSGEKSRDDGLYLKDTG